MIKSLCIKSRVIFFLSFLSVCFFLLNCFLCHKNKLQKKDGDGEGKRGVKPSQAKI